MKHYERVESIACPVNTVFFAAANKARHYAHDVRITDAPFVGYAVVAEYVVAVRIDVYDSVKYIVSSAPEEYYVAPLAALWAFLRDDEHIFTLTQ